MTFSIFIGFVPYQGLYIFFFSFAAFAVGLFYYDLGLIFVSPTAQPPILFLLCFSGAAFEGPIILLFWSNFLHAYSLAKIFRFACYLAADTFVILAPFFCFAFSAPPVTVLSIVILVRFFSRACGAGKILSSRFSNLFCASDIIMILLQFFRFASAW